MNATTLRKLYLHASRYDHPAADRVYQRYVRCELGPMLAAHQLRVIIQRGPKVAA